MTGVFTPPLDWGEAQQPILDLVPAYAVLPEDAQAEQAAMLANNTNDIPQDQFDALKEMINQGVPQTEVFWVRISRDHLTDVSLM